MEDEHQLSLMKSILKNRDEITESIKAIGKIEIHRKTVEITRLNSEINPVIIFDREINFRMKKKKKKS